MTIDYDLIFNYIEGTGRECPYDTLHAASLADVLEKHGTAVVEELSKITDICTDLFDLICVEPITWLDRSKTKTKKYLWIGLKDKQHTDQPMLVSIYGELGETSIPRLRVSLDISDGVTKEDLRQYHVFLNKTLTADKGLYLAAGSDAYGRPSPLSESVEAIKDKTENRRYRKVQLCRDIPRIESGKNEYYEQELLTSIIQILPYYYQTIGMEKAINKEIIFSKVRNMMQTVNYDKNMILYGPPGTGKTYTSAEYAVAICDNMTLDQVKKWAYADVMSRYNELKAEGRIQFTTFHQSYGYEDFIEGIKPVVNEQENTLGYAIEDGVFKAFCKKAIAAQDRIHPNYVFVIDEINRGNISKIFGELITLLEDTKRAGMEEAASATLPYSGEQFSVPGNVYLVGTMNTADRSIAWMDTALRRRFRFVEMMPNSDILRRMGAAQVGELDVAQMLDTINERITYLYDREHTIGHAFFTGLAKNPTIECLQTIFQESVIPLLQEYFYEDYQKIQLVLGDNGKTDPSTKFVQDEEIKIRQVFKGNAEDVIDLPEKKYRINPIAFKKIESYLDIM